MKSDPDSLVFSKSLALIQKTRKRVKQVDPDEFPTDSSGLPRDLLLQTLETLGTRSLWPAMSPEALYSSLIHIQDLVEQLEASNSAHISWPLVSYCDHIWKQFFSNKEAQIFYSVMTEHNYGIGSFSLRLKRLIEKILPPSHVKSILKAENLYCLQMASLEDENLPLYANIGHEFGHAVFLLNSTALLAIVAAECDNVFRAITSDIFKLDPVLGPRRRTKAGCIIRGLATELFCDVIGFLISGPAFILSLHEMAWGVDQASWTAQLTPASAGIRAYPSFRFRLDCLRKLNRVKDFQTEATKLFKGLAKPGLAGMAGYISSISTDHTSDKIQVTAISDLDNDSREVETIFGRHFEALKIALQKYVERCWNDFVSQHVKDSQFPAVSAADVFELLRRLENDILPNIIPKNNSLLGEPASFGAILNASAFYRIHALATTDLSAGPDGVYRDVQKVERLTAKALEVSYIQGEFKKWEAANRP
jgi:hypothetical protein